MRNVSILQDPTPHEHQILQQSQNDLRHGSSSYIYILKPFSVAQNEIISHYSIMTCDKKTMGNF